MSNVQDELQKALLDVRKAFRLLWLYQRRVLDIIHLITDKFNHEFYCWAPMGGKPPGRMTTDPTDNWAWSMLPFYQLCLLYPPSDAILGQPKKGEWLLEIGIQSDDGFPIGEEETEPDPTQFPSVETCSSILSLRGGTAKSRLMTSSNCGIKRLSIPIRTVGSFAPGCCHDEMLLIVFLFHGEWMSEMMQHTRACAWRAANACVIVCVVSGCDF